MALNLKGISLCLYIQYIELRSRVPNKEAVLLKVGIVCSERISSCRPIQRTNNTARDLGFSDSNITKIDFQWSKRQQAKYSEVVSKLVTCKLFVI